MEKHASGNGRTRGQVATVLFSVGKEGFTDLGKMEQAYEQWQDVSVALRQRGGGR